MVGPKSVLASIGRLGLEFVEGEIYVRVLNILFLYLQMPSDTQRDEPEINCDAVDAMAFLD